jgi:hypothetical protein
MSLAVSRRASFSAFSDPIMGGLNFQLTGVEHLSTRIGCFSLRILNLTILGKGLFQQLNYSIELTRVEAYREQRNAQKK